MIEYVPLFFMIHSTSSDLTVLDLDGLIQKRKAIKNLLEILPKSLSTTFGNVPTKNLHRSPNWCFNILQEKVVKLSSSKETTKGKENSPYHSAMPEMG